jgi:scyllo-inositol 2-dehydrogenase (NADP+)
MHRLGFIGFGGMAAGYHYETSKRSDIPDLEPAAVYDVDPQRREFAKSKGLAVYDSLQDFLDSRAFDIVLVATPNNYHRPMVEAALGAGYNVMVEKPAAITSADFRAMMDAADRSGKLFTVHQNRRWDRDFLIAKAAIEEGDVGAPYMIESRIHGTGGTMTGWRGMADHGGGMLLDWGVHMLDQVLWLIKEPVDTVYAVVRSIKTDEVDDYAKVIITFESGLVAQVEVATFTLAPLPRFAVYGDKGGFMIEGGSPARVTKATDMHWENYDAPAYGDDYPGGMQSRTLRRCVYGTEKFDAPAPEKLPPQDWASLYKNVLAALDGKEELVVKPVEVLRVIKVIEAAFESSRTNKAVKFVN